ncbi:hypothetical protein [Caulobacter sp. LARHSG274]
MLKPLPTALRYLVFAGSLFLLTDCAPRERLPPPFVLWAWERPEDLRFLGDQAEVAVQTGFVELAGDSLEARGRRFPLRVSRPPTTTLVHVQIDRAQTLVWTPRLRARTAQAVLHYANAAPTKRVQIDFEVRASERQVLLDLLSDVRRGLPRGTLLSMTALASWCDTEIWLDAAPVDEITPMLFRMQGGQALVRRLAKGGDFRNPRCRTALAISTDTPIVRVPPGRRIYLFNPHSWTSKDFEKTRREVGAWRARDGFGRFWRR